MPTDPEGVSIIRHADLPVSPWANRAGTTRQVASGPDGAGVNAFDWRISVAEVVGECSFSAFPGIDRTILVVHGNGMELAIDGVTHPLEPLAPLRFDGASEVTCMVPDGPSRDLNIMCRRGDWSASVEMLDARKPVIVRPTPHGLMFLGCFAGRWSLTEPTPDELEPGDFLRLGCPVKVQAAWPLIGIRLTPSRDRHVVAGDDGGAAG